ncbi:hypothetical protein [Nocardia sienata]|uniref:hypothetical protein n=1 Tax=Nocardia sienata TaxID=248552 RepID=UPI0012EE1244|nr:hypothetical protein [Nocardia sienata]
MYSQRSIDIEESNGDCRYTVYTIVDWDKAEPTVHTGQHQAAGLSFRRRCDTDSLPIVGGPIGFGSMLEPTPQLCFEQAGGLEVVNGTQVREYQYILEKGDAFCGITPEHNVVWFKVIEVDRAGGPMARIKATLWTRRA